MLRRRASFALLLLTLTGCPLTDALTAHVDVAARAGSAELSSKELAQLMAGANMPPRKDIALAISNLWVNYQLVAQAASRGDTAMDNAAIDEAMWAQIAQSRLRKFQGELQKTYTAPTAAEMQAAYDKGDLLVARHILISAQKNVDKPAKIDSARRVAESVRKQATPANFVSLVKKYSSDPGSKDKGGEYVFPAGMMVPEFEAATRALKPGEISDPVQTNFGFHVILRESYADAKTHFDSAYQQVAKQKAESVFIAGLDKKSPVQVKDGTAKLVKAIAEDVDSYRNDRTVIATAGSFDLRAARIALWIAAFPPQMQIRRQLAQVPDSVIPDFVKGLARQELMLKAADSAKINLEPQEIEQIRGSFRGAMQNTMGGLNILPAQLADSAKTNGERETLASTRIAAYLNKLVRNEAQFVDVSEPVSLALRRKYDAHVSLAGIDRALTQVNDLKSKADSTASANMPKSEVPMPGASVKPPLPAAVLDSIEKSAKAELKAKQQAPETKKP